MNTEKKLERKLTKIKDIIGGHPRHYEDPRDMYNDLARIWNIVNGE